MAGPNRPYTPGGLFLVFAIGLFFLPLQGQAQVATELDELGPPPAVEGRLVVKYAPSVSRSAQAILAERGRFEGDTGSPTLDDLNAELGVWAARPLVMDRGNLSGARATARYFDRHAQVRALYPQRAARAPLGARAPDLSNLYVIDIDPKLDVHEAARRYAADPAVLYATPDYIVRANFVPDDPFFASTGSWGQSYEDLWGLHILDAATAWDVANGLGIVVAVVDTGIDLGHPDLTAKVWTNPGEIAGNGVDDDANGFVDDVFGWDFAEDDNDPTDGNGHGTHVAGTIAAVGNNGVGVIGMSWGAQVMAVQGLGANGSGSTSDVAAGIIYAAENGADIINNSYVGFVGPSLTGGQGNDAVADAIATARAMGAVVVASAGNDGLDLRFGGQPASFYSPAGVEGTITVGASASDDSIASFSNYGRGVSVSAPGVDVLSLKGEKAGNVGGETVAGDYLRLNGTSMAGPHVAGLAALLLSGLPSLSIDEVQWHIELSADQPGYPGWEGEAWNPWHGWGRVNAGRIFDTPAVTTRLETELAPKHTFPGEILSPSADVLKLTITTSAATPWTATLPQWMQASPNSGTTGGPVAISYDSTDLSPGSYNGTVAIEVPGAVDGGAATPASLCVHRDERVGPEMILRRESATLNRFGHPVVVSNGLGTLVVWNEPESATVFERIMAVHLDAAGAPSAPFLLHEGSWDPDRLRVATDGDGYIVLWTERICKKICSSKSFDLGVVMVRLDSQGRPIDASPLVIEQGSQRSGLRLVDVDFDGAGYTLLLEKGRTGRSTYYARRLGREGALWNKKRKIGRYPAVARFACATGTCLMGWLTVGSEGGVLIYGTESLQIVDDRLVDKRPTNGASNFLPTGLVSDGTSYLFTGQQRHLCGEGDDKTICRRDVVGARMAVDGSTVDPQGIVLNINSPLFTFDTHRNRVSAPGRSVFDGTSYLLPFTLTSYGSSQAPKNIFIARLRPDGTLMDAEDEGLLVRSEWTNVEGTPQIAVDALHSIVVYGETIWESRRETIYAVAVLARSADPSFVSASIGTIGTVELGEGETIKRAFSAPGLDPDTTTYSAADLPFGAYLDAATGLFSWRPNGAQAGSYDLRFQASDGSGFITEDVTIEVIEASLSLSGTVRHAADGSPGAGISLKLKGFPKRRLLTYTDAQGRFRFDDLIADRRYNLRMDRPSSREFRMDPRSIRVRLGTADVSGLELDLTPK